MTPLLCLHHLLQQVDVIVEVEVISWVDSGVTDPEAEEVDKEEEAALVMVAEVEVNQLVE